jgi:hypothetical protein
MSVDGWVAIDDEDLEALQRKGWLPVSTSPMMVGELTNGRGLTNGRESTNGRDLTSGPGMVNGLGYTAWRAGEDAEPVPWPHPAQEELIIVDGEDQPSGMEYRKDLINGFSILQRDAPMDPKATWGIRSWNRRVALKRMRELAARPLPGTEQR